MRNARRIHSWLVVAMVGLMVMSVTVAADAPSIAQRRLRLWVIPRTSPPRAVRYGRWITLAHRTAGAASR